ncbi:hypothetical protein Tco_0179510, partial [Tanacetum coccineum]
MDSNFTNENDPWEYSLDIDDSDLHLTLLDPLHHSPPRATHTTIVTSPSQPHTTKGAAVGGHPSCGVAVRWVLGVITPKWYSAALSYFWGCYTEYVPLEDEHVFPAEEQPLPPVDSLTAESPEYVTESDPKEDPEEYKDDESEDGLVDYPMDRGDDGDDDNGDSSGDDANDEDADEDKEDEEEHVAPADSAIVVPTDELVSPPEGTEPDIPPPSTNISTTRARITVRLQASISLPPEAKVERLLAMTTPSPSPHISLSPPSIGERLARCTAPPALSSPPPVPSPLLPSSGFTAALPSPPLPPLPPSLYIPPPVDRRDDIPESEQPPRKRLFLSTLGSRFEVGESSTARPIRGRGTDYGFVSTLDVEARRQGISEVGYGIRDTWVDPAEAVPEIAPMTVGEVNTRVTELAELHEHDTQD